MFNWLKVGLSKLQGSKIKGLALVANWLAGLVWVIEDKFLSLATDAYGKNEVVYAGIRLLSQSVAEPPLKAYTEKGDDKNELPRDHKLTQLIRRPNELMTEYEFWELVTTHCAIVGRSYWWKERSNSGEIISLWPLRPDRVGPLYSNSDKAGERVIRGWWYQIPDSGQYVEILRRDVLAFNLPDPSGQSGGIVEGIGPCQVLATEISADNEASVFVGALLANYAAPTVVLKVDNLPADQDQVDFIKATFRNEFGGSRRGVPAVINAKTEITPLGFNLQQLEFPQVRAIAETRICAAIGVPAILVGVKAGLDRSTFANMREAREFLAETTCSTYWRRFSDQYTNDVAAEFGDNIVCEFDTRNVRALAGQIQEKLQPIKKAYSTGAVTRNEYRQALGLDPFDDAAVGEVFLVPTSVQVIPVSSAVAMVPVGGGENGKEKEEEDTEGATNGEEGQEVGAKFNPYHDERGRFTSGSGASSLSLRPYSEQQKERMAQATGADKPVAQEQKPPKREKQAKVPEEVAQKYPETVDALGSALRVDDWDNPIVKEHMADLALIPVTVLADIKQRGIKDVHIGNKPMTELDSNQHLQGVRPTGWSEGKTWDMVPGSYSPAKQSITAGRGAHGSASLVIHETAHAIGMKRGHVFSKEIEEHHVRLYNKLSPYYQQGGPKGHGGMNELYAESTAIFLKFGRSAAVSQYDEPYVKWLESTLK